MTEISPHFPEEDTFSYQFIEKEPDDVSAEANFEGNWFNLQSERMKSPDFRTKFLNFLYDHIESLTPGEPSSPLDKPKDFQSHYEAQAVHIDETLNHVTSAVFYGSANSVGGSTKSDLGHGAIAQQGTVYSDAELNPSAQPLSNRQKDIVAAHEAYHGVVDARGSAADTVRSGFDWSRYEELIVSEGIRRPQYLYNADELLARMAQFKNYFGMSNDQVFTASHLDHLRQHYVNDTGLDNSVSITLEIVTEPYVNRFVQLMNTLPV